MGRKLKKDFINLTCFNRIDTIMNENVYKKIELTGSSANSIEQAVNNALSKASESVRNMRWFEILETRGSINTDKVQEWQVTIKVGFTIE